MKKFRIYIDTMYRPSFLTLCAGLSLFCLCLCALAINLRADMLLGKTDIIYKYPKMLEEIIFPLYILLPITLIVDLNERKKN